MCRVPRNFGLVTLLDVEVRGRECACDGIFAPVVLDSVNATLETDVTVVTGCDLTEKISERGLIL